MESAADTASMREQAARVRSTAESIQTTTERLAQQTIVFEGAAAERMRDATTDRINRARQVVTDLQGLTERMLSEAANADAHGAGGSGHYGS